MSNGPVQRKATAQCSTLPGQRRQVKVRSAALTALTLTLVACNPAPSNSAPTKATQPAVLPYANGQLKPWKVVSTLSTDGSRPKLISGYLSDQLRGYLDDKGDLSDKTAATEMTNGWGPVELDLSNGDKKENDGENLSLSGVKFAKGLGVHARSELVLSMDGTCTQFTASVGIDDSVRAGGTYGNGSKGVSSVSFKVLAGDAVLFDSKVMTEKSATQTVNVRIPPGAATLRLEVGDGGNGDGYDHADWANARVECGENAPAPTEPGPTNPGPTPPGSTDPAPTGPGLKGGFLSDQLNLASAVTNGWGDKIIERDRSNGDKAEGDGQPLSLSGVKFAKGLGVHAISSVTFPLNGSCSTFKASVGIDDSVRAGGKYDGKGKSSVVFRVLTNQSDVPLFDSGVMTEKSATQNVDVTLPAGARSLRLYVSDGGNGNNFDHGDWAGARVECAGAGSPTPTPLPPEPIKPEPIKPEPAPGAKRQLVFATWEEDSVVPSAANAARINSAFTHMVIAVRSVSMFAMGPGFRWTSQRETDVRNKIAAMRAAGITTDLALIIRWDYPGDPITGRAAWDTMVEEHGKMVKFLDSVGIKLIVGDNEIYGHSDGNTFTYFTGPTPWLQDWQNQTQWGGDSAKLAAIRDIFYNYARTLAANHSGLTYALYHSPATGDGLSPGWITPQRGSTYYGTGTVAVAWTEAKAALGLPTFRPADWDESYVASKNYDSAWGSNWAEARFKYRKQQVPLNLKQTLGMSDAAVNVYPSAWELGIGFMEGSPGTGSDTTALAEQVLPNLSAGGAAWYYHEGPADTVLQSVTDGLAPVKGKF